MPQIRLKLAIPLAQVKRCTVIPKCSEFVANGKTWYLDMECIRPEFFY